MTKNKYQTKEVAITVVTQDGNELKYCTPELQNNEGVTMTAIKKWSWSFEYASTELKSNKAFIMKALNEGVYPWGLIDYANMSLQSDLDVMFLTVEKSNNGWEFRFAKEEASLNKELAAKALVKWGNIYGSKDFRLWSELYLPLQNLFPKDSWHEKAHTYLNQIEQKKQAELVTGGSTEEDEVTW